MSIKQEFILISVDLIKLLVQAEACLTLLIFLLIQYLFFQLEAITNLAVPFLTH